MSAWWWVARISVGACGLFELTKSVAAIFGILGVTVVAAAVAAYWAFKIFAKGWIQRLFDRDLEELRAAKGQELERLRADISRLMDRATKFHEREYEVLPEAWGLLNTAHGAVFEAVSSFQQYPDFNKMTNAELEDYIEVSDLMKHQKDILRKFRRQES